MIPQRGTGCACSSNLTASYPVRVPQYRALPQYGPGHTAPYWGMGSLASFTACLTANQPRISARGRLCDLLMVQGVTPAHKSLPRVHFGGLTPSRLISYLYMEKMPMPGTHMAYLFILPFSPYIRYTGRCDPLRNSIINE